MPVGIHSINIPLPIADIWDFVSVMDKWAPLVPGYITHDLISKERSTWEFTGDMGLIKKKIKLQVDITQWSGPNKVTFDLTGLNEKFFGCGYFIAEAINLKNTRMTGCLDITAKGMKAPMANSLLKSYVPETTTQLADAIAEKLIELNKVNK